jgi:hypothetical protein
MPFNEKGEFIRAPARAARTTSSRSRASFGQDQLITMAQGLGALVVLVGLVWLVLVFRQWIVIGLVLWLASSLRGWLRGWLR